MKINCVLCGASNDPREDECWVCGYMLEGASDE